MNPDRATMYCERDLSKTPKRVTGSTRIVQALYRRLITPRGMLGADPSYGFCVEDELGESFTSSELETLKQGIVAECLKEPEVRRVEIAASYELVTKTLRMRIDALGPDGPFSFVVSSTGDGLVLES